jgi:hypothetical protein
VPSTQGIERPGSPGPLRLESRCASQCCQPTFTPVFPPAYPGRSRTRCISRSIATSPRWLEAVSEAVKGSHASNLPATLLVNADQSSGSGKGKEVDAFTHAAVARGITVTPEGFDFDA